MKPRFEIEVSADGEFFWKLVAGNGETVAVSETYTRRADAERAIDTVKALAAEAVVIG